MLGRRTRVPTSIENLDEAPNTPGSRHQLAPYKEVSPGALHRRLREGMPEIKEPVDKLLRDLVALDALPTCRTAAETGSSV